MARPVLLTFLRSPLPGSYRLCRDRKMSPAPISPEHPAQGSNCQPYPSEIISNSPYSGWNYDPPSDLFTPLYFLFFLTVIFPVVKQKSHFSLHVYFSHTDFMKISLSLLCLKNTQVSPPSPCLNLHLVWITKFPALILCRPVQLCVVSHVSRAWQCSLVTRPVGTET